jgi:hypothetical protein
MTISSNIPYQILTKLNVHIFINSLFNPFTNESMQSVCHSATDCTANTPATKPAMTSQTSNANANTGRVIIPLCGSVPYKK